MAKLRAIEDACVGVTARKAVLCETQNFADLLLEAEMRLGEILAGIPDKKHLPGQENAFCQMGSPTRTPTMHSRCTANGGQIAAADTTRDWLSRMDKDAKEARNKRIFDLWLACWGQDEIAKEASCSLGEVNAVISELAKVPNLKKSDTAAAEHATDFHPPKVPCGEPSDFGRFGLDASISPSRHPAVRSQADSPGDLPPKWLTCCYICCVIYPNYLFFLDNGYVRGVGCWHDRST